MQDVASGAHAAICSLRWGELAALRRRHIDMSAGLVRIEVAVVELTNGALVTGPPKSASGVRWVSTPLFLLSDVAEHLKQFTGTADDQLGADNSSRTSSRLTSRAGRARTTTMTDRPGLYFLQANGTKDQQRLLEDQGASSDN